MQRLMSTKLLLYILFAMQGSLLLVVDSMTSFNQTEVGHLGAAVYLCQTSRNNIFRVNPPLTRYIISTIINFISIDVDKVDIDSQGDGRYEVVLGKAVINSNRFLFVRTLSVLTRISLIPFILLGSYYGCKLSFTLFGKYADLIFMILWTFSPIVLGWGGTICPDVFAASVMIIAFYYYREWLLHPNWLNVFLSGSLIGLSLLSKLTMVLIFPICVINFLAWRFKSNTRDMLRGKSSQLLVMFLLSIYTINVGYFFNGSFRLLKNYTFRSRLLTKNYRTNTGLATFQANRFGDSFLGYLPLPLPADFINGIDEQRLDFEQGMQSYINGTYSDHGWWYYYIYLLSLKEPVGTLILFTLSIFLSCFNAKFRENFLDEFFLLSPAMVFFVLVSSQTGFSLHPRYIIPALPFLYIWISKLRSAFVQKKMFIKTALILILFWIPCSTLLAFPHLISYTNELTWLFSRTTYFTKSDPPPLLGSNLDWGQSAYFLKNWYDKNPNCRPFYVDYPFFYCSDQYQYPCINTETSFFEPGYYAIGINELFDPSGKYTMFKSLSPFSMIGNSIYIYRIAKRIPSFRQPDNLEPITSLWSEPNISH